MEQKEPKKRKRKIVMNNVSDIEKRCAEVEPMSLFGASAMTFPDKISTTRSGMAVRHTGQYVVLSNPEFPRMYTGAENEFGERSSWNIKVHADHQLMKTFIKFKDYPDISPVCYILKDLSTGKFKCIVHEPAHHLVERYGFKMYNKIAGKYSEGDVIPADTPVSQSSSYVNGNYCSGRNIRLAYAVLPELTEDALIISDYAAKVLEYDMVDIVTVNIKKDAFLLDKYGNGQIYKPFPNIGEQIQNHVLCSIRENSYVSSRAEAAIPHINDKTYFSSGTVVDIDIFTNTDVEDDQTNYYLKQIRDWYSDIYSYISTIVADPYQDDTSLIDIYHKAEKYLSESTWVTKEFIVNTVIRFKILKHMPIRVGQKLVGRFGNKSVVTKIIPRHLMPRTADGRPIDMLANALAVPNRIIAFATYEASMTFMQERMWKHMIEMDRRGESHDKIMDLAIDFINQFEPQEGGELARLYREHPVEIYNDVMKNGLYIQIRPLNEVCVRDALLNCYEKWPDIMKKYKIQTKLRHRWVTLDGEYAVGYQYTWVLKQEPSKAMSTVATGKTTWYDQPVKSRLFNKHLRHYSDNPIKFGEYDTYNFLAGVGVREFSKITTYFRGSQYEENSMLMAQLNNIGIDTSKYNQFPQIDNLKNILKLLGIKMKRDPFGYSTIGSVDETYDVMMNNIKVNISVPDLRYVLMLHSSYLQYQEQVGGMTNMDAFFATIEKTDLFDMKSDEYRNEIYHKFVELLPTLQQMKQYC